MSDREKRTARITLRVTPDEKALLQKAANSAGTSVSGFICHYALSSAQHQLEGRIVSLRPDIFEAFAKAVNAPPSPSAKLRELLDRDASWDK